MTIIWGTNFSVIKTAFRELDPQAFNAVRMVVASLAFLVRHGARRTAGCPHRHAGQHVLLTGQSHRPSTGLQLAVLGLVGHVLYQFCFIGGLARTSVANSSLMLATTPVLIALHQRGARATSASAGLHWIGAAVSTGRHLPGRRPGHSALGGQGSSATC